MYMILGLAILGLAAFLLLTIVDLIKYLLRKKKNGAESGPSFPQTLKRNLIILPIGCAVVAALLFILPLIFPVK